jgi:hypothetical protein
MGKGRKEYVYTGSRFWNWSFKITWSFLKRSSKLSVKSIFSIMSTFINEQVSVLEGAPRYQCDKAKVFIWLIL